MTKILRPVPFITSSFGHAASKVSSYSASIIDPVTDALKEEEWFYEIRKAFVNEEGDKLFDFLSDWYFIPRGKQEAYKLCSNRGCSTSSSDYEEYKIFFLDELTLKTIALLKYERIKEIETCAIAYTQESTFDKPEIRVLEIPNDKQTKKPLTTSAEETFGFNRPEIRRLTPLNDAEKAALQQDIFARKLSFVSAPDIRGLVSAFQKGNGDFLIVSKNKADQTDYQYKTFKIFTGPSLDLLREIPVTEIEGYNEGTKIYHTTEGCLFAPAQAYHKLNLQWLPADGASAQTLQHLETAQIAEKINDPRIVTKRSEISP